MVTILVASDLLPDKYITVTKNPTELPNKFFVDYYSAVKAEIPQWTGDPTNAIRYVTWEDCTKKLNPNPVTLTDAVQQSGFSASAPPNQVLFFVLENKAG
jgi:hypothetical protein